MPLSAADRMTMAKPTDAQMSATISEVLTQVGLPSHATGSMPKTPSAGVQRADLAGSGSRRSAR